jgi:hypothetical protein
MKSRLAVSSSIILLILIAFPEGLQCGTIYKCVDKNGTVTLSDRFLEKGYKCMTLESFRDITDEERMAWEIESKEKAKAIKAGEAQEKQKREMDQLAEQERILKDAQRRKEEQRLNEQADMIKREEDRRIREEERQKRALQIQEENLRIQQERTQQIQEENLRIQQDQLRRERDRFLFR